MKVDISKAQDAIEDRLCTIRTVTEWADAMGYNNAKEFSRLFRDHFNIGPKKYLDYLRLKSIQQWIKNEQCEKHYIIARNVGLQDEYALYKFVKKRTNLSPSELKQVMHYID